MSELDREHLGRLEAIDAFWVSVSNTLDVKASIVLVAIVFLAEQAGKGLAASVPVGSTIPPRDKALLIVSCVALGLAGVLAAIALWPRTHLFDTAEGLGETVDQARLAHPTNDPAAVGQFRRARIEAALERIAQNVGICESKSFYVGWALRLAGLALLLILIKVAMA